MSKAMKSANLFWAVVWTVMAVLGGVSIFWTPCHFATLVISSGFAVLFWYDYKKTKDV